MTDQQPQPADAQDVQAQAGDVLTVTLRPVPGVLPGIPLAVRWRGALKVLLLRRFGLRASWPAPVSTPSTKAASSDRLHPRAQRRARIDGKGGISHDDLLGLDDNDLDLGR